MKLRRAGYAKRKPPIRRSRRMADFRLPANPSYIFSLRQRCHRLDLDQHLRVG